jgi:hypothetical protein
MKDKIGVLLQSRPPDRKAFERTRQTQAAINRASADCSDAVGAQNDTRDTKLLLGLLAARCAVSLVWFSSSCLLANRIQQRLEHYRPFDQ